MSLSNKLRSLSISFVSVQEDKHKKPFKLSNSVYSILFFSIAVDISVYYKGFHGDLNETFFVGKVDERYKKLVRVSWECLDQAIKEGMQIV